MKIDNAILSVNDKDCYQRLWPDTARTWNALGITPKLYWVSDSQGDFPYPSPYGTIIKVPLLPMHDGPDEIPMNDDWQSIIESQVVRIYGCAVQEGINILSDIDMFPVSRKFFINNLEPQHSDQLIILSAEFEYYIRGHKFSACYYVGKNILFKNMIYGGNSPKWDTAFIKEIQRCTLGAETRENLPWMDAGHSYQYNDEYYLFQKLLFWAGSNLYDSNKAILMPRWSGKRIILENLSEDFDSLIDVSVDAHFRAQEITDFDKVHRFADKVCERLTNYT